MTNFNDYFTKMYGKGTKRSVNGITGMMYGDSDCFNIKGFCQFLVVGDRVYKCFYKYSNQTPVDYENAVSMEDVTDLISYFYNWQHTNQKCL